MHIGHVVVVLFAAVLAASVASFRNTPLRLYCYAYALVASGFGADIVVEADLGLYDYCALVPILEGAGGVISDWNGRKLTLQNHEMSKGRVLACSNLSLHHQAVEILNTPLDVSDNNAILAVAINQSLYGQLNSLLCGVVIGEIIALLGQ